VAEALHKLAVVDDAAAERRFGHAGTPTETGDLFQQLFRVHALSPLGGVLGVAGTGN